MPLHSACKITNFTNMLYNISVNREIRGVKHVLFINGIFTDESQTYKSTIIHFNSQP